MMRVLKLLLRITTVLLSILAVVACVGIMMYRAGAHPDCEWTVTGLAFVDVNGNHVREPEEPPLAGVTFRVDDTYNHLIDVGRGDGAQGEVSNSTGTARASVWLPGCPRVSFVVYALPPVGYALTTPERVAQGTKDGQTVTFGFAPSR